MGKRTLYTNITPLPSNIPRQLALDMLHSHGEIIELNPLVIGHKPIKAPQQASADEFFAAWEEIEEKITWGLGMSKKIKFKGVFHDMPWGLQTHIYAPMGVDLRNKWQIRGNQPGELHETRELGIDTPADGLYLREDVEITCNVALTGFVKKETKASSMVLVQRLLRKAELLDEGRLQAMFAEGKLRTFNPATQDRHSITDPSPTGVPGSLPGSPSVSMSGFQYGHYYDVARQQSLAQHDARRISSSRTRDSFVSGATSNSEYSSASASRPRSIQGPVEIPPPQGNVFEAPGSYYFPSKGPPAHMHPANRMSFIPELPASPGAGTDAQYPGTLQDAGDGQYPVQNPDPLEPAQASPGGHPAPLNVPKLQQQHSEAHYEAYKPNATFQHPNVPQPSNGVQANRRASQSQQAPYSHRPADTTIKCPVCGQFEGDVTAVTHHVSSHYT